MKSVFRIALAAIVCFSFNSCSPSLSFWFETDMQGKRKMAQFEVLGQVSKKYFTSYTSQATKGKFIFKTQAPFLGFYKDDEQAARLKEEAYNHLLAVARKKYEFKGVNIDNIDIVNIEVNLVYIADGMKKTPLYFLYLPNILDDGKLKATGDVVLRKQTDALAIRHSPSALAPVSASAQTPTSTQKTVSESVPEPALTTVPIPTSSPAPTSLVQAQASTSVTYKPSKGMNKAIQRASASLIKNLPDGASIALIHINSNSNSISSYAISEMEFHLVAAKNLTIISRHKLDTALREQNIQADNYVSDEPAMVIGEMTGASVVITGDITYTDKKMLSLKAMDAKTGRIIAMVREFY